MKDIISSQDVNVEYRVPNASLTSREDKYRVETETTEEKVCSGENMMVKGRVMIKGDVGAGESLSGLCSCCEPQAISRL